MIIAPTRCPRGWGLYVCWLQANEDAKAALAEGKLSEPLEIAASRTLIYKETLSAYRKHIQGCPECKSYLARLEQSNERDYQENVGERQA